MTARSRIALELSSEGPSLTNAGLVAVTGNGEWYFIRSGEFAALGAAELIEE